MMELKLQRLKVTPKVATIGALRLGTDPLCATLERAPDADDHPCIPAGRYELMTYDSPGFGRRLLLLKAVPGRSWIEIHVANQAEELKGCIAVGQWDGRAENWISHSRQAFDAFIVPIVDALDKGGEAWITVIDVDPFPDIVPGA